MIFEKTESYANLSLLHKIIKDLDLKQDEIDKITKLFEDNPTQLKETLSAHLFQTLDTEKDSLLSEHYEILDSFRQRLFKTWELPLKRLDSLLYICMEITDELRRGSGEHQTATTDKFNLATRLHARCIQIGNEISHLLHGGYADGAFARWRTLHETSATAMFICEGDEDLACRFFDYQNVWNLDKAIKYNKNNILDFESVSAERLLQLQTESKAIIDIYEPSFKQTFGWARKALGTSVKSNENVKFTDIEKFVGLSFLRNHFSFANQYVHAGTDSIGYKLGTSISNRDLLLTGPSNEGLIEPIQCTSLSLTYATIALLNAYPTDESPVRISVLNLWHEILKHEVFEADAALQAKGKS